MWFVAEIEAVSAAGLVQWRRTVEKECGIVDVVLLTELGEEVVSGSVVSGWFELRVQ
jgi:hypothetical protein